MVRIKRIQIGSEHVPLSIMLEHAGWTIFSRSAPLDKWKRLEYSYVSVTNIQIYCNLSPLSLVCFRILLRSCPSCVLISGPVKWISVCTILGNRGN